MYKESDSSSLRHVLYGHTQRNREKKWLFLSCSKIYERNEFCRESRKNRTSLFVINWHCDHVQKRRGDVHVAYGHLENLSELNSQNFIIKR